MNEGEMEESEWSYETIEELTEVMHDTFMRAANEMEVVNHPYSEMPEGQLKEAHRKTVRAILDRYLEMYPR